MMVVAALPVAAAPTDSVAAAQQILNAAGIEGGLIVQIGCGDGTLTAALRATDSYVVHALDTEADNVARTRELLRSRGLLGRASADRFDGRHLPYAADVVNLVVVSGGPSDPAGWPVPVAELRRVLAPGGCAVRIAGDDGGQVTAKLTEPWPAELDDWTHYLHGPDNNAVSRDTRVGPPRRLQWQCGPKWSRHHDHMASMSAMVTAKGRLFYILDEGSRLSPQLPPDWQLVARDAFNGVLLWKRPIEHWFNALWPLKSGPADLPRRLVAVGDTVYVTLGIDAPVSALEAASGKTLRTYEGTAGAEELVCSSGVLLVLVDRTPMDLGKDLADDPEKGRSRDSRTTYSPTMKRIWAGIRSRRWSNADRVIRAFDAASGRLLWEHAGQVIPLTLGADAGAVFFHDGKGVVALELTTGAERWASSPVPVWQGLDGRGLQSWFAPTLVARDGKVLFAGGEKMNMSYMGWGSKDIGQDTMTALSAATGEKLWTAPHPYSGYNSPEDLFVANGKVYTGNTAKGGGGGMYLARDLATGKLERELPPTVNTYWFHHRCYRAKATEKYILCSRAGIEFVDLDTGKWDINHWVRGGCLYGIMPANGLIYAPLHPCACYPESKLSGFCAVAPALAKPLPELPTDDRLQRGPAYGKPIPEPTSAATAQWPTYRHDPARSGVTDASVSAAVRPAWRTTIGERLTPPVLGEGLLFAADIDRHLVHALDAMSGRVRWSVAVGGRVDSAPTYDRGRLLFGSNDGWVYCLRASDGALIWRFRGGPRDRRLVVDDQVESVWPVHGAVLVHDGVACFVAGRSMYLDGGLRLCRLAAATGALKSEIVLDSHVPDSDASLETRIKGLNMPVALPDVLSTDGTHLFMRSQTMDLEGKRPKLGPGSTGPNHLFAPYGFTDDSWFHRTYWLFGDAFNGGVGGFRNGKQRPAGRILVNTDAMVYGYGRKPSYYRWGSAIDYQLFAAARPGAASAVGRAGVPTGLRFDKAASLNPQNRPLTIAAWIETDKPDGTILARGANAIGFALIVMDGKPRMLLRTQGTTHQASAAEAIGKDWTHVAGVLSKDGRMAVYVNGSLAGETRKVPLLSGDPIITMKVGFDDEQQLLPGHTLTPFDGALDEVMLFHRALSEKEIRSLAQATPDRTGAVSHEAQVLHLDFTDGSLRDRSGAGNDGRPEGAKLQIVDGPRGAAARLRQPKRLRAAARRPAKSGVTYQWTTAVPILVRAMVLADNTLFIAGPEDLVDEDQAFQTFETAETQKQLALQDAACRGERGARLCAVAADTGKTVATQPLASPPVFDGLVAAGGRLFATCIDGSVQCYAPPTASR